MAQQFWNLSDAQSMLNNAFSGGEFSLESGAGEGSIQQQSSDIGSATVEAGKIVANIASGGALFDNNGNRTIAIVLGLLCIAGGIFLFKSVRTTVVTTTKAAAKVAAA